MALREIQSAVGHSGLLAVANEDDAAVAPTDDDAASAASEPCIYELLESESRI